MVRTHPRPSFANVVSLLALFVALGGSAYAALSLPANSVGTKQLRNRAVTLKKISRSARRSLRGHRGRQGIQGIQGIQGTRGPSGGPRGPRGLRGIRGPQGIQGLKGATGAQGPSGMSGYEIVKSAVIAQAAGTQVSQTATCPGTKKAVGGGVSGSGVQHSVNSSLPVAPGGNAWKVTMNNNSAVSQTFTVYAVCVSVAR